MTKEFPSPLEVYRFISKKQENKEVYHAPCFRPLSRYIGLYLTEEDFNEHLKYCFRPLSRYIGLYLKNTTRWGFGCTLFPSPLEVYRFISIEMALVVNVGIGFRPLSRYIGLYQEK